MRTERTAQQVACDGVRAVWSGSDAALRETVDAAPQHLSIDGIVVPGTVRAVAAHMHRRDMTHVLARAATTGAQAPLTRLIGTTIDGIRLPLRPAS